MPPVGPVLIDDVEEFIIGADMLAAVVDIKLDDIERRLLARSAVALGTVVVNCDYHVVHTFIVIIKENICHPSHKDQPRGGGGGGVQQFYFLNKMFVKSYSWGLKTLKYSKYKRKSKLCTTMKI